MTMRIKVLLVMGMALSLLIFMGLVLHQTVLTSRASRDRLILAQEQIDSLGRLHVASEQYLRAMVRARDLSEPTAPLLAQFQEVLAREQRLLERTVELEHQGEADPEDRPFEREETQENLQALRGWAVDAEQTLSAHPMADKARLPEWALFEDFERDAGQLILNAQQEEYAERDRVKSRFEDGLERGALLALVVPSASCVVLLVLMLIVLVPLGGALQELVAAAQRIGAGELQVRIPEKRRDELGTLARAFNHMAAALSTTLEEKQRLMRAESEARQLEAERSHALLEQKVHERTAQLEQANLQLTDSLAQLKETQAQLFFADRLASLGRLAAGVGHEINNPLSYVLSNLNYVHRELVVHQDRFPEADREELLDAMSQARDGAERVRIIVKDLKELARPSEDDTGLVELNAVVRTATKLVSREVSQRARLVEDCEDVPPVRGNGTRLGQVFLNLLINATHALPAGQPDKNEIRVTARQSTPEHITVEVSDTGCGIAPEHLDRIFDPFFTTKPVGEGTGLGLSVCHSIVTSLGGQLTVRSTVGQGTTFRLVLPVASTASRAVTGEGP